jgi:hypothetical protein
MCQLFCHHFIRVDRSASSNSGSFASATRASSMAFTSSRVVAATRLFCGAVDLPFITGCAQRVGSFTYQGQSVFNNGCFGARLHHAHCVVWCWPSRARVWCHSHCSSSQRSGRALREGSLNLPGTAVFSSASSVLVFLLQDRLALSVSSRSQVAVCGSFRRCRCWQSQLQLSMIQCLFTCSLNVYSPSIS